MLKLFTLPLLISIVTVQAMAADEPVTPKTATKEHPFVNSLGMKFVPVPITGGPTDGKLILFSIWDTRVQDYNAFLKETYKIHVSPNFEQGLNHPVVNVSWDDSVVFCEWLRQKEHIVYRLPSDHEWSCAVGIGKIEDGQASPKDKLLKAPGFPWDFTAELKHGWPPPLGAGNFPDQNHRDLHTASRPIENYQDGYAYTSPVGSFTPNNYGLYDMSGNVWQWCQDKWNPLDTSIGAPHVTRGGSWDAGDENYLRSSYRGFTDCRMANATRGFRCVLEVTIE